MLAQPFTLSAFGDEIAPDLTTQLEVLRDLQVGYLELRAVGDVNVLDLDERAAQEVSRACQQYGIAVSCLGSPIGKSPIEAPLERELANLERIFRVADITGTRRIRIFSFYPPAGTPQAGYDEYVPAAAARIARLVDLAEERGYELLLENEKDIVGDTPERCRAILDGVNRPSLRLVWDPANFVQVGAAQPTTRGWPLLGRDVGYVHVKDAVLADGSVLPAGHGDGEVAELLRNLRDSGYRGFLAVEPHLVVAGHSSGFSGPEGMRVAVTVLRELLARLD
jgi:sugar phosphate isomerase/epimerase